MIDETLAVTVQRPEPSNDGRVSFAVPEVQTVTCPPCLVPLAPSGLPAQSPLQLLDTAACGVAIGRSLPLVTQLELERHPRGSCAIANVDPWFVYQSSLAVTQKIADHLGLDQITPCYDVRTVKVRRHTARIPGLLRLDKAEIADGCGCHRCDAQWRELRVCDLMVGPRNHAPWTTIESCRAGLWCGGILRLTGIWGDVWPIEGGVQVVALSLVSRMIENAKSENKVVSNRETGSIDVDVPEFDMVELAMLPNSLVQVRGWAV